MSLDLVDLVCAIERTFGIELPPEKLPELTRVGPLYDCILEGLDRAIPRPAGPLPHEVRLADATGAKLRRALADILEVVPEVIQPETPLALLLPRTQRRRLWAQLGTHLNLRLRKLRRPWWLPALCGLLWLAAAAAAWPGGGGRVELVLLACVWGPGLAVFHASVLRCGWLAACVLATGTAYGIVRLCVWGTRPCAVCIARRWGTVGGLARVILRDNFGRLAAEYQGWHRDEVWEVLRSLLVDVLGVRPEQVTREAQLVKDLGAD